MDLETLQAMEEEYNILKNEYDILSSKKSKLFRDILEARKELRKQAVIPKVYNPYEDLVCSQFGLISTTWLIELVNFNAPLDTQLVPDISPIANDLKHRDREIILKLSNGIKYKDVAKSIGLSTARTYQIVDGIKKKIKHPRVFKKLYTWNKER